MSTALQQAAATAQAAADKFGADDISDEAIAARRAAAIAQAAADAEAQGATDTGTIATQAAALAESMVAEQLPGAVAAALPAAVAAALPGAVEAHLAANPPQTATSAPALAAAGAASQVGTTVLGFSIPQVVSFLGMIAGAVVPGASLAGFTIAQLTSLGVGVANEIPEAVQAFEEIKAVAESGQDPTPEQWAAWNAAADAANQAASSAEDAVIAGKPA